MTRVQSKQPLAALDTLRYSLPVPSDPSASEEEWQRALDNARSQLEHQSSRYVISSRGGSYLPPHFLVNACDAFGHLALSHDLLPS